MSWFWDYSHLTAPHPYGPDLTYQEAAEFLDYGPIEDWGCGSCYAKKFFHRGYIGVDLAGPFADRITDLVDYRSATAGILLRHVLEHNVEWQKILRNAVMSAPKLAIVLFTPLVDKTNIINWTENERGQVPDISLSRDELLQNLRGMDIEIREFETGIAYGKETLITAHHPL